MVPQTARAGPPRGDAETGPQNAAMLGGLQRPDTANLEAEQVDLAWTPATSAAEPPPALVDALDNLRLDAIVETTDLAASLALSAREAAWRGDRITLRVHLLQLRLSVIETLKTFKELGSVPDQLRAEA
jgi:hypothetical protein